MSWSVQSLQYCLRWTRHPDMLIGEVASCIADGSVNNNRGNNDDTEGNKSDYISSVKDLTGLPGKDLTARWENGWFLKESYIWRNPHMNWSWPASDWATDQHWECIRQFLQQLPHTFARWLRWDQRLFKRPPFRVVKDNILCLWLASRLKIFDTTTHPQLHQPLTSACFLQTWKYPPLHKTEHHGWWRISGKSVASWWKQELSPPHRRYQERPA